MLRSARPAMPPNSRAPHPPPPTTTNLRLTQAANPVTRQMIGEALVDAVEIVDENAELTLVPPNLLIQSSGPPPPPVGSTNMHLRTLFATYFSYQEKI